MKRAYLPVKLENSWLLLSATRIREILGAESWTPIPRATAEMPGVMAWHGHAIPVIDLARILRLSNSSPHEPRRRTLIVEHEVGDMAIPINDALEVTHFGTLQLREAHAAARPYAEAEADWAGELMTVINLEAVLNQLAEKGRANVG